MRTVAIGILFSLFLITSSGAKAFTVYGFIPWKTYSSNGRIERIPSSYSLDHLGIKKMRVIYHKDFLKEGVPDEELIKNIALSTENDKAPISFDIEVGHRFKPETNLPVILKTLKLYRKYGGKAPVGIYAVLPQNTGGGKKLNSRKIIVYQQLNQKYAEVASLVDFISPSLYNYDGDDFESWKKSADYAMSESRKYAGNKPIIPYIRGTYRSALWAKANYSGLTEEQMHLRLDYLKRSGAAGVIVWQSSRELNEQGEKPIFNTDAGWGKAVKRAASTH